MATGGTHSAGAMRLQALRACPPRTTRSSSPPFPTRPTASSSTCVFSPSPFLLIIITTPTFLPYLFPGYVIPHLDYVDFITWRRHDWLILMLGSKTASRHSKRGRSCGWRRSPWVPTTP
jgi:hypothetical protein